MIFIIPCIVALVAALMMIVYIIKNMIWHFIITAIVSIMIGIVGWNFFEKKYNSVIKSVRVTNLHI